MILPDHVTKDIRMVVGCCETQRNFPFLRLVFGVGAGIHQQFDHRKVAGLGGEMQSSATSLDREEKIELQLTIGITNIRTE